MHIFRRCYMGIKSLFGFGQARDKPVDKAADAGYSFCLEGQQVESLSMKELQCRPRQCMPVSGYLRKQLHP